MATKKVTNPKPRGGYRVGSGRPPMPDKRGPKGKLMPGWAQLTVTLRADTVQKLRAAAGKLFVGDFLQEHLERFPIPTREQYEEYKANLKLSPDFYTGKAASTKPELMNPEQKERARFRQLFNRASPAERKALRLMYPKFMRQLVRKTNADQKEISLAIQDSNNSATE